MDLEKIERLKRHAEDMGYVIDDEVTMEFQSMANNSTITLRLPDELKRKLKHKAAAKGVKYQKYLRELIIEDLKKIS